MVSLALGSRSCVGAFLLAAGLAVMVASIFFNFAEANAAFGASTEMDWVV